MKVIKTLPMLLAAALMLASLSGCGEKDPFAPTAEDKKAVMKIAGENVEYQEYRYFFLNNKRDEYGASAELTADDIVELQRLTAENIKNRHTLWIMADEYKVKMTKEDEKNAESYVDNYRASCGDDESYLATLEEQYITDDLFRDLSRDSTLAFILLEKMKENGVIETSEASVAKTLASDEIICIKEIYVDFPSEELRGFSMKRIEEAYGKLQAGESFESLMEYYSSYGNEQLPYEHGYYTMKYNALDEIWPVAENLDVGEYSDIIESQFGFHIVLRCEKDVEYMETNRDAIFEDYTYSKFYEEFFKFYNTLTPEFTDFGSKLDFVSIS